MRGWRYALVLIATMLGLKANASPLIVYDNGAITGLSGRNIGFGVLETDYRVTNSFQLLHDATINAVQVGLWSVSGTTPATLSWAIGSSAYDAGLASGIATLTDGAIVGTAPNFDVFRSSFHIPDLSLSSGDYFFTLFLGRNSVGGTLFWDVASGPSVAFQTSVGEIDSNSFQLLYEVSEPHVVALLLLAGTISFFARLQSGGLRARN